MTTTTVLPPDLRHLAGRIIDVDSHEMMPIQEWVATFGPEVEPLADAWRNGVTIDEDINHPNVPDFAGDVAEIDDQIVNVKGSRAPGAISPQRRLRVMDVMGIDRQLMFPGSIGLYGTTLLMNADDPGFFPQITADRVGLARRCINLYQDWLIDFARNSDRVRPVAPIAEETLPEVIATARRLIDSGIRAIWLPAGLIVNDRARRFCDESWFFHEQSRIREFDPVRRRYPNLPAYLIFDQNHRDRTRFGPYLAGRELPDKPFVRSETLAGLATALGLPGEALNSTVARFNGCCAAGRDDDFGRGGKEMVTFLYPSHDGGNPVLGPIERGPFYGVELQAGGLGANQAGLRTDDNAVVQHLRERPIEGLYAVGNAAAHLDFGPSYISGGLIARGLVWAYVAARHAAGLPARTAPEPGQGGPR